MRFLADMGISPGTVNESRRQGHDAVHLVEQGLERLADGDILVKARNEARVLLTGDEYHRAASPEDLEIKTKKLMNIALPATAWLKPNQPRAETLTLG